jgi:hypothetical protein
MMHVALEFYSFASDMLSLSIAKAERSEVGFASNNKKSTEMQFAQKRSKVETVCKMISQAIFSPRNTEYYANISSRVKCLEL